MTILEAITEFANQNVGSVINRQAILCYCYIQVDTAVCYYARETSIDTTRRMLTRAGYLQTVRPGQYKVLKLIPNNLTMSMLREQAYGYKRTKR